MAMVTVVAAVIVVVAVLYLKVKPVKHQKNDPRGGAGGRERPLCSLFKWSADAAAATTGSCTTACGVKAGATATVAAGAWRMFPGGEGCMCGSN